jgi:hypothetical protein
LLTKTAPLYPDQEGEKERQVHPTKQERKDFVEEKNVSKEQELEKQRKDAFSHMKTRKEEQRRELERLLRPKKAPKVEEKTPQEASQVSKPNNVAPKPTNTISQEESDALDDLFSSWM